VAFNRFQQVSNLVERNEIISSDRYLDHALDCLYCEYLKSDFFFRRGEWRGSIQSPLFMRQNLNGMNLIAGHSDKSIRLPHQTIARLLGIRNLWGINTVPRKNFAFSLPLGLTNNSHETPLHNLFGDASHLMIADSTPFKIQFDGSIYANFNVDTNRSVRAPLLERLKALGATVKKPELSVDGRVQYLRNLRSHSLVPCPEGNGVDTHRLWETLYMGGTPVVISNKLIDTLVKELPVIVLKDWSQISDLKLIDRLWGELNSTSYNFEQLKVSYWINKICQNNLSSSGGLR
jgi:hypothetical protein